MNQMLPSATAWPRSIHSTVGLYWFSSFNRFAEAYTRHYADPAKLEKGERYVGPVYNTQIASGGAVYIHDVLQSTP